MPYLPLSPLLPSPYTHLCFISNTSLWHAPLPADTAREQAMADTIHHSQGLQFPSKLCHELSILWENSVQNDNQLFHPLPLSALLACLWCSLGQEIDSSMEPAVSVPRKCALTMGEYCIRTCGDVFSQVRRMSENIPCMSILYCMEISAVKQYLLNTYKTTVKIVLTTYCV